MRFKDFKLPEQEPTLTKQITDPQKKPSLWSKIKTDFNKGRDITKQTSGSSAGNIIQQVGALGKGVKKCKANNNTVWHNNKFRHTQAL